MWNSLLSILKYVYRERLFILVGLPKSVLRKKILVPLFDDQMFFARLNTKKVSPSHISWVIS